MSVSKIIFLGSGYSSGVPLISCLTNDESERPCKVCISATSPDSKNLRQNTSLLIQTENKKNILIDCGKYFRQSALLQFPKHKVRTLDAVILTHAHWDAMGGLDDLRDLTMNCQSSIPIFLTQQTLNIVEKAQPYLVHKSRRGMDVSELQFRVIGHSAQTAEPFSVEGLKFTPLPVEHGEGYYSLGFNFEDICYISDASSIPEDTVKRMAGSHLIILDALNPYGEHRSHFCVDQAGDFISKMGFTPQRCILTDLSHRWDYESGNEMLTEIKDSKFGGVDVQLSYDGMVIDL